MITIRFFDLNGKEHYEAVGDDPNGKWYAEVNEVDDQVRNAFPIQYAEYKQSQVGEVPTIDIKGVIQRGIN